MQVKISELTAMKFLCLRNTGDYWKLPQTWQVLWNEVEKRKLIGPQTQVMILFHDHHDAVPMEDKRSDAAVTVPEDYQIDEEMQRQGFFLYDFPGGKYAVTPHFGSTEEIGTSWDRWRREWLPESGWQHNTGLPSLEWYQNNPQILPPELLLTHLCDPVKPGYGKQKGSGQ